MKTERKPLIKESYSVKCPHCNKDLPAEIDFCPYCMERLTSIKNISPPTTQGTQKKKPIIAALVLLILAISFVITGVLLKSTSDKNQKAPQSNRTYTNQTTAPKNNTQVSDTQNPKADTSYKPSFSEETTTDTIASKDSATKSNNSTTQSSSSAEHITIETEIVNRWNNANNDLYIYNFILNNYTFKQEKEQICISQRFSNSGAKIDFRVKDDFEEYTLKIDNITNLSVMYQLCRISLSTIALNQYSDTEFYDFISDNSWETVYENKETKSGIFFGYNCNVVLTELNEPGAGGLDYTYYTCILSVKKVV